MKDKSVVLPIHHHGAPIAGIGVAGGPSGLSDEAYAAYAAEGVAASSH
ncbi:hypothetical protein ACIGN6_15805 [Streptomyces sp. NPDC053792]